MNQDGSAGGPHRHQHGISDRDRDNIRIDLGRLDKLHPDLGQQLIHYVCVGDNDSILLTAENLKDEIGSILNGRYANCIVPRLDFLLTADVRDPAVFRRYGEVLIPVYSTELPGTSKSPSWFRTLLQAYGKSWERTLRRKKSTHETLAPEREPWTIEWLRALLREDEFPILDTAFDREDNAPGIRYSPENMPGFEQHLGADPGQRVAEMRRLSAKGRCSALRTLARLGLTQEPYLDFAIDQTGDSA